MLRSIFLYLSQQKSAQRMLLRLSATRRVAKRFVAGETLADGIEAVRHRNEQGMMASLDHLGEHVGTLEAAAAAREDYRGIIAEIARQELRSGISVKLTQLGLDISEEECLSNLRSVVEYAGQTGHFVRVDMEGSA
jgi:proline dehydrogenase